MSLTVINAELVRRLLPMEACIDVMADAMIATSAGAVAIPPRSMIRLNDRGDLFGLMPGSAAGLGNYGAKIISLHPDNPAHGRPAIQGFVALFDATRGAPLALVEGSTITAIRTAAASGLATRLLARDDARSCGIFGSGVQAVTHIDAIRAVRPLERVLVWGRDTAATRAFAADQARRTGLDIVAADDPGAAAACDIVCTVTGSPVPVLLGDQVQAGAHINLVGAHTLATREADSTLVAKARVYTDLLESLRNEGGDIMIPLSEGAIGEDHIVGEIGRVAAGELGGRVDAADITLYKSLGITAQDLYAARYVFDAAVASGLGEVVAF